ncbi:glutaminyl tRS [Acrasis kona]|uniref:glutamine--tRNA ligase n=1 Tax=Acrasis kona TaxID=1008807 RepID=A0AAW2ZC26_9EUKA
MSEDATNTLLASAEQISASIANYLDSIKSTITKSTKSGPFFGKVRLIEQLKSVDPKVLKDAFETQWKSLISNAPEADKEPKKEKKEKKETKKEAEKKETETEESAEGEKKDRFEARFLESAVNSEALLEQHKEATGGKVRTRFPPEPNGFLHIGHAKAMNLSFGYAQEEGGDTYLRYDDTNPEKEEQIYFDSIKEMVLWLGFTPKWVTYTSDYFDQMYECAIKLIKKGLAYMDFSTKEAIKAQRDNRTDSPYRNTSVEENLKLFEHMRRGYFEEGKAVLRVKIDMQHDNPNMRDFIAYRIKYAPHPHVGDKWCIYPSYDFSHCLVDSMENITHSLCTLEFEIRRDSYYWLLQALDMYRPKVYEFSRLNVTGALLSKRKILALKNKNVIRGFDDPRVMTLAGLRRRGYTPEAIRSFCKDVGVTRNANQIPNERLEQSLRTDLDGKVDRAFCVTDPLRIELINYPADKVESLPAPNHPVHADRGTRMLPFSKILYIEKSDFRLQDDKTYYGLAPNKEVGLRFGYNITCKEVVNKPDGSISHLLCEVDLTKSRKPKGHIHWLAQPRPGVDPIKCKVFFYDDLFVKGANPEGDSGALESSLNPDSLVEYPNAFVDPIFHDAEKSKVFEKYQFERLGYFVVDSDSKQGDLIFNRSVSLKVDKLLK